MVKRVTSIDIHVGKRLKLRRIEMGLSQEKLAKSLQMTFQQIQKYEKGVNRVSAGKLYELAVVLAVPVEYFFEELGESEYTKINFDSLNKQVLVISRLIQGVPKERRADLIATVKNLIKFAK